MEKQLKLEESGLTAHLKQAVTYGEHQHMQSVLMSAAKGKIDPTTQEVNAEFDASATIEWTYAKILTIVTKFVDKDGKEIPSTIDAIKALPMNDGQLLEKEVESILDDIKKKQAKTGTK